MKSVELFNLVKFKKCKNFTGNFYIFIFLGKCGR